MDSVDQMVQFPDPISEKIVHLVAKYNAVEDCMAVIKKSFENDEIKLKDFLQNIRQLSGKQCKQMNKMFKINEAMNSQMGANQVQNAYSLPDMPVYQQQPGQQFMGYQ